MKRLRFIGLALGSLLLAVGIGIGIYHLANGYLSNAARKQSQQCSGTYDTHFVEIQHNKVVPSHTQAQRCDHLTIINRDPFAHLMAFGEPEHHISYDGVSERLLNQGQSMTVTLIKTGTYDFHDHLDDERVVGSFNVSN